MQFHKRYFTHLTWLFHSGNFLDTAKTRFLFNGAHTKFNKFITIHKGITASLSFTTGIPHKTCHGLCSGTLRKIIVVRNLIKFLSLLSKAGCIWKASPSYHNLGIHLLHCQFNCGFSFALNFFKVLSLMSCTLKISIHLSITKQQNKNNYPFRIFNFHQIHKVLQVS